MNVSSEMLTRFNNNVKFRDIIATQLRHAEIETAVTLHDMFTPFLDDLRQAVVKLDYELGINPWIEEDYRAPKGSPGYKVRMEFLWEPLQEDAPYATVKFTASEKKYVTRILAKFSSIIGMTVTTG